MCVRACARVCVCVCVCVCARARASSRGDLVRLTRLKNPRARLAMLKGGLVSLGCVLLAACAC